MAYAHEPAKRPDQRAVSDAKAPVREVRLKALLFALLALRLCYPFFNSPLAHLFSDPQRHWDNAARFLDPSIMGANDPFLYQAWLYALRTLSGGAAPAVIFGCGLLCAAMPYGWYRALRECRPRRFALIGALLIGLIPESLSVYGYFMNETLLLTLLGFCIWQTLRARRKRTAGAFALACVLWSCAALTRTLVVPMAACCVLWLWTMLPQKLGKAIIGIGIAGAFVACACGHAQGKLHFFAPFGNLYFNEIYSVSGRREIAVDYGPDGFYHFGGPSFYNPTFYPFSTWTTARNGVASIRIDLSRGRTDWISEKARIAAQSDFPPVRAWLENLTYLLFGQIWPNSTPHTPMGWLTLWSRWLWPVLIGVILAAAVMRRYRGDEWLLPAAALGTLALLMFQSQGVMEARFREPIDPMLLAAVLLIRPPRQAVA